LWWCGYGHFFGPRIFFDKVELGSTAGETPVLHLLGWLFHQAFFLAYCV
jgi:hypothetical protein